MENVVSKILDAWLVPILTSVISGIILIFLGNKSGTYEKEISQIEIDKAKDIEDGRGTEIIEKYDATIIKLKGKAAKKFLFRLHALCFSIFTVLIVLLNKYIIQRIENSILQVQSLPYEAFPLNIVLIRYMEFDQFLALIAVIIGLFTLGNDLPVQASSNLDTGYKSFSIISLTIVYLFGFSFFYGLYIDCKFFETNPDNILLNIPDGYSFGDMNISWKEINNADHYIIKVNGETVLKTKSTQCDLTDDVVFMQNNEIQVVGRSFGVRSYSDCLNLFALPKIDRFELSGEPTVGNELSIKLIGKGITDDNMNVLFDYIECTWLRDGVPIEGAQEETYILGPEDHAHDISANVSVSFERKITNITQ